MTFGPHGYEATTVQAAIKILDDQIGELDQRIRDLWKVIFVTWFVLGLLLALVLVR